ncbi:MAG: hypothetical protein GTO45_29280, partial [Candidatus Aminicenantes bacterium]|nr:hypothetical protein [Candidatus Aminicenantes bacterium]NIN22262.1 hypothetical protein [Candidatus Aminicenantes bacterium]NIN46030.1 hypothetical protein [Candidatus Aminicenantes bacterium]NIN88866.1 hypothetical protein [Candidatus Aminicenantes bacterium]NIO85337.1 hypothetical protein [Candidatus Aminicenantes bacterium]
MKINKSIAEAEGRNYSEKLTYIRQHKDKYGDLIDTIESGLALYQTEMGLIGHLATQKEKEIRQYYTKRNAVHSLTRIYHGHKLKIWENANAIETWKNRFIALSEHALPKHRKEIQSIIKELTEKEKRFKIATTIIGANTDAVNTSTEAIGKYSDALGIATKEKVAELTTKAAGLVQIFKANKDSFEANTEKANALKNEISKLSAEMETFGVTAPQSFKDTKKEVA